MLGSQLLLRVHVLVQVYATLPIHPRSAAHYIADSSVSLMDELNKNHRTVVNKMKFVCVRTVHCALVKPPQW